MEALIKKWFKWEMTIKVLTPPLPYKKTIKVTFPYWTMFRFFDRTSISLSFVKNTLIKKLYIFLWDGSRKNQFFIVYSAESGDT